MNEVNSVLVATDFSESAQPAVDAAIMIAKRFDAQLHVVQWIAHPNLRTRSQETGSS